MRSVLHAELQQDPDDDDTEGGARQQCPQRPSAPRRGEFLDDHGDRHRVFGAEEDAGQQLEQREGPDVPRHGRERGAHRVPDHRPQQQRPPAPSVAEAGEEEGQEVPDLDQAPGDAEGGLADGERVLHVAQQQREDGVVVALEERGRDEQEQQRPEVLRRAHAVGRVHAGDGDLAELRRAGRDGRLDVFGHLGDGVVEEVVVVVPYHRDAP
jgi:hypothetical protein